MSDIDWSKPVECERHGVVYQVLHDFVLDGRRYVVLPRNKLGVSLTDEKIAVREVDDLLGTFRNVRRKVKHKKSYWLGLYADGLVLFHGSRAEADEWRNYRPAALRCECREITIEWEADADE